MSKIVIEEKSNTLSKNQVNELALAREMQLMFNYAKGFTPIGEGLNKWQGNLEIDTPKGKIKIPVEVLVPLKFPQYPPRVIIKDKSIVHPNVEKDGNVLLQITHEWKPDKHVYQVIKALEGLFEKVPPKTTSGKVTRQKASVQTWETVATPNRKKVEDINVTISELQKKIRKKDDEIRKLRAEVVKGSDEKISRIENLDVLLPSDKRQSEKILLQAQSVALADLLSTLDEKFKDGEISPVDFAKLYRRYTKEMYITHKKLEQS